MGVILPHLRSLNATLTAFFCLLTINSCNGHEEYVDIEYPFIRSARYDFSDVTKVTLTDTATIVTICSKFVPNYVLDCGDDWSIMTSGQEYCAKGGIGISPGGSIKYGNDGFTEFSVIFDAIPKKTKSFDLLSGNKVFDFYGVDLTGKEYERQDERVPFQEDVDRPFVFDESFAESSINIHLINHLPGTKPNLMVYLMQALSHREVGISANDKGEASIRFLLMGSSLYQVGFPNTQAMVEGVINPGEAIDVYIDMNAFGHNIMRHREGYRDSGVRYLSTSGIELDDISKKGFWDIFNVSHGFDADEYVSAQGYVHAAENGELTFEDFKRIDSFNWDFLTKSLHCLQEKAISFSSVSDCEYHTIENWSGAKEMLYGIAADNKGKIVLIDLWNTWCAPCREAMNVMEPLKTGALESDDIVWIYLADDSSPIADYTEMLGRYKGVHYRLTKEQMKDVRTFLGTDGIPYYVLVDRDGRMSKHPDFRDHDLMVQTLLDCLEI